MKHLLITVIILIGFYPLFSQKDTSQFYNKTLSNNNFSIELGGKSILYSIGYERTFYKSKKLLLSGNVNVSYYPLNEIIMPIGVTALIGNKQNKLLFGLYATNHFNFNPYPKTRRERLTYRASNKDYYPLYNLEFIMPYIGYRRYFKKGNSLSIAFTPAIEMYLDDEGRFYLDTHFIFPWFGINYNLKL